MDPIKKVLIVTTDRKLRDVLTFCFDGWGYEVHILETISQDLSAIKRISPDTIIVDIRSANKADLDMCRLLKNDFITASIPVITLINKRHLRTQLLHLKQGIDDYLIKPPDPLDLRVRVEMAMRRSTYNFYASPLTGLPGGRNIEEAIRERLNNNNIFSFAYLDLDNFKYYNDAYGYHRGDRALMQSAYLLYTTLRRYGNPGDFLGHIGGDDFVFITTPDKFGEICHHFITSFDRIMPFHYSQEDRQRGFVIAKDRTRTIKKITLMSVSIAVVSNSAACGFKNVIEVNERVAEVKRYLKGFSGSKFMEDRRNNNCSSATSPHIYKIEAPGKRIRYKPIGQILLDHNAITLERLDEALSIHWRRGLPLGEILKELGFIDPKTLDRILNEAGVANPIAYQSKRGE